MALIPLVGHSPSRRGRRSAVLSLSDKLHFFQTAVASDNSARRRNQERLRELARDHGDEVRLFCAHDPVELGREQTAAQAGAG